MDDGLKSVLLLLKTFHMLWLGLLPAPFTLLSLQCTPTIRFSKTSRQRVPAARTLRLRRSNPEGARDDFDFNLY